MTPHVEGNKATVRFRRHKQASEAVALLWTAVPGNWADRGLVQSGVRLNDPNYGDPYDSCYAWAEWQGPTDARFVPHSDEPTTESEIGSVR